MTRRTLALGLALMAALSSGGTTARADAPSSHDESAERRAEARFHEGSAAFDAGRVAEACAAFEDSVRTYATLGALLNLALCHERQGRTATAWTEFTRAAAWAGAMAQRDRAEFARTHVLRLERDLSRVELDLPADPSLHVAIDGQPLAQPHDGLPLFLDPGSHVVTASAPGRTTVETPLLVPASPSGAVVVAKIPPLEAQPAEAPPPPPPPSPPSPRTRTTGWLVAGAGVLSLGSGIVLVARSVSLFNGLGSSCRTSCNPGPAAATEALSLVAIGAGVAGVAVGSWLVVSPVPAAAPRSSRVVVAPRVTAQSEELTLTGTW